jgi:hypothetical protein
LVSVPWVTEYWLALSEHEGAGGGGALLKLAVTVCGPVIARTQAPVPLQSPPQPPKKEAVPGVATSETAVPIGKLVVQKPLEQLNTGLELVTVPAVPAARPKATVRDGSSVMIVATSPVWVVTIFAVAVAEYWLVPLMRVVV